MINVQQYCNAHCVVVCIDWIDDDCIRSQGAHVNDSWSTYRHRASAQHARALGGRHAQTRNRSDTNSSITAAARFIHLWCSDVHLVYVQSALSDNALGLQARTT